MLLQSVYWDTSIPIKKNRHSYILYNFNSIYPSEQNGNLDLYNSYSQSDLLGFIEQSWNDMAKVGECPWMWALKMYIEKYPKDIQAIEGLRHKMGPLWLYAIRQNNDDWEWLYKNRLKMNWSTIAILLQALEYHALGEKMALEHAPMLDVVYVQHSSKKVFAAQYPSLGVLDRYGAVVLRENAPFYMRWRALLICLYNNIARYRASKNDSHFANIVFLRSCKILGITARSLWKDFEPSWRDYAKPLRIQDLENWDTKRYTFLSPTSWQERLRSFT